MSNKSELSKETESLLDMCREAYSNGVKSTLTQLREVYGDGIEETDLWAEYMTKEPKLVAFDKWLENKETI